MEQQKHTISLTESHRGSVKTTSFTGRPEGKAVRAELKLDICDSSENNYNVVLPSDTTSFNPSFFLGLFFDSIKKLGWDKFSRKYVFDLSNMAAELKTVIKEDLDECERKAKNELKGLTGLD